MTVDEVKKKMYSTEMKYNVFLSNTTLSKSYFLMVDVCQKSWEPFTSAKHKYK